MEELEEQCFWSYVLVEEFECCIIGLGIGLC